jgi:hypothetical protein
MEKPSWLSPPDNGSHPDQRKEISVIPCTFLLMSPIKGISSAPSERQSIPEFRHYVQEQMVL